MKRLEEMHMLAEALDKRRSASKFSCFLLLTIIRWHGESGMHSPSQGQDR